MNLFPYSLQKCGCTIAYGSQIFAVGSLFRARTSCLPFMWCIHYSTFTNPQNSPQFEKTSMFKHYFCKSASPLVEGYHVSCITNGSS
jgi:hypothetical protein